MKVASRAKKQPEGNSCFKAMLIVLDLLQKMQAPGKVKLGDVKLGNTIVWLTEAP
jgi:hypothetical protein